MGALQAAIKLAWSFEISLAIDMSLQATEVYHSNFEKLAKNIILNDITNYFTNASYSRLNKNGKCLIGQLGKIDVLLAGPPCQGNSDLNNISRRVDPRNDLYFVPILFTKELQPDLLIVENVPAVVHGQSNVVSRSIAMLEKSGYVCHELRTDLTALGLPQTRKRHLLVASRIHTAARLVELLKSIPVKPRSIPLAKFILDLEDISEPAKSIFSTAGSPSITNLERINYLFDNDLFDLPNSLRPPCHRDKKHSYSSMYGRLKSDAPSQTITSGFGSMGQGRFVHPTRRRTLTPHEAARIQGFPDYFSFDNTSSITELRQMIGNAVAPVLSYAIITKLLG